MRTDLAAGLGVTLIVGAIGAIYIYQTYQANLYERGLLRRVQVTAENASTNENKILKNISTGNSIDGNAVVMPKTHQSTIDRRHAPARNVQKVQDLTDAARSFLVQLPSSWVGIFGNRPDELSGDFVVLKFQASFAQNSPTVQINVDSVNFRDLVAYNSGLQRSEANDRHFWTNYHVTPIVVSGATQAYMETGTGPSGIVVVVDAYGGGRAYTIIATGFAAIDDLTLEAILASFKIGL